MALEERVVSGSGHIRLSEDISSPLIYADVDLLFLPCSVFDITYSDPFCSDSIFHTVPWPQAREVGLLKHQDGSTRSRPSDLIRLAGIPAQQSYQIIEETSQAPSLDTAFDPALKQQAGTRND